MNLNIFIVLLLTLFIGGHSLKCYECAGGTSSCVGVEKMCPTEATGCISATIVQSIGDTSVTSHAKACNMVKNCVNGSLNFGLGRTEISTQCCNTDLCNSRDVPVYSSKSPNGKQCYYCNEKSCLNKLNCLGAEDSCITAATNSQTVKGCVTKSICDGASQAIQDVMDFSCCQGNLCNSPSIIQNLRMCIPNL